MNKILTVATAALMSTTILSSAMAQSTNSSELSDPRVRQAIAYAIDMGTIVETIFEGAAVRADGLIPVDSFKPDDLNSYDYDPDKARELLADAGWDGSRELDIVYYYNDQLTADFMAAVQAYLGDVGITVSYRLLEGDVGAQISTLPENPVDGPSAVEWDLLYGARAAIAGQEYYNRFAPGLMPMVPNVPEMNVLVNTVNGTADPAVQADGFQQMEKIINDAVYILPLYYQQLYIVESDRLSRNGAPHGNDQYNYNWDVVNWTVEPNADGKSVMYTNNGPAQFFEVPWQNLGIWTFSKFGLDTILEADGSITPVGGEMAESYDVSADGLTFTFTLRDDMKWHDGEPITVEDVIWSIETSALFPITHPVVTATMKRIAGAEAFIAGDAEHMSGITTDGNTITIKFAEIDPNVLLTFTQFAPLPMAHFEGTDPLQLQQDDFWQNPIGSGPFMIEEVRMNDFTTLVPFPDYYGGVAKIEQIVALPSYDGDPNLLVNAASGRVDYAYTKNTTDVPPLVEMENMTVTPANVNYTRMFWINQFPRK